MSDKPVKLSVNIDHVATVRQARRAPYPDPVEAAKTALEAGADGITVHLREDRRHIQDRDVERLCGELDAPINLEIAGTEAMVRFARQVKPAQVTLVPERPDEITTEGGLDLDDHLSRIRRVSTTLAEGDIAVSLFLDPEERLIELVSDLESVRAFEINTDAYTKASLEDPDQPRTRTELADIARVATLGAQAGNRIFAGHGLTTQNVGPIAAIPEIEELNIGHFLIARAVIVGLGEAVREMQSAIRAAKAA